MTRENWTRLADRFRPFWGAAALVHVSFIYWSSSRTWEGTAGGLPAGVSNFVHFPLYGILGGLLYLFLRAWRRPPLGAAAALSLATGVLGFLDECHQASVPGRDFSLWDVGTDISGAFFVTIWLAGCLSAHECKRGILMPAALVAGLLCSFVFSVL